MKSRVCLILALLLPGALPAQTPTRVQAVDGSNASGATSTVKVSVYKISLPHPSLAGNAIVVGVTWGSTSSTVTISDNAGGNTWTAGPLVRDNTQVESGEVFFCVNCTTGTQQITATISATANFVSMAAYEYFNVAQSSALDGSHGQANGSGTSIQPGSFTTAVNGDLIFQIAFCDGGCSSNLSGTFSAQSGFKLTAANTLGHDIVASQDGVQSAAGAINPTITSPTAISSISIGIALKAASAGTAPSGIQVLSVGHRDTTDETASSRAFQFPCHGNLIVLATLNGTGSPARSITAVSDTNSNTWAQTTHSPLVDASGNTDQIWYAANATCSENLRITLTITGSDSGGNGETYMAFDVSGAASSPFNVDATATGTQTVSGTFAGATITPSTANGLIVSAVSVAKNNVTAVSASVGTANYVPTVGTCSTGWAPPIHADENNGWAALFNSSTSATQFTWSQDNCQQTGVGAWANLAAAFKATSAATIAGAQAKIRKLEAMDPP